MRFLGKTKKHADDVWRDLSERFERDGFAILNGFFSPEFCDRILQEVDLYTSPRKPFPTSRITLDILHGAHSGRRVYLRDAPPEALEGPYKINHLFTESDVVADAVFDKGLRSALDRLLGAEPVTINSLNFRHGSQQPAHIDTWYMPPPKTGSLVVASLSLEDVHPDAGPLFYYPGSHRIPPYVFSHGGIHAVDAEMPECRAYLDREIAARNLKKEFLFGKKGDVFLWHAQLLHGGSPINDLARTRSSLVVHYWGLDAVHGVPLAARASGGKFLDRNYWETDGKPIEGMPRPASPVAPSPAANIQSTGGAPLATRQRAAVLPEEFDAAAYRQRYSDLRELRDAELDRHYRTTGKSEERNASKIATRKDFLTLIDPLSRVLEIGPFANPLCHGANVKYFDVLPAELLRERAKVHGVDPAKIPNIDYVSESGDFQVVDQRFDIALSCHVIEHQPDLIRHLQDVGRVLDPGGLYCLVIPDKRYCFDHFLAASSIAEIVAAHARGARVHDVLALLEHAALTTHNDSERHWLGDHGEPVYKSKPRVLREAADVFFNSKGRYIDVHAWQFVPGSFRDTMESLFDLRLSAFRVLRVYATVAHSNEFFAVLEKTAQSPEPLLSALPRDFDARQYLLANPDVAKAGADAAEHYLRFGRAEGRKLRPS